MSITASDINGAQSWGRLNHKQRLYLCKLAEVPGSIESWERVPVIHRQEIREAAGRLVCFASSLGGFIQ
jgi:hypothetical protein